MKKDVAKRVKVQPVFEGTILSKARKIIDRRGVLPVYKGKPVIAINADGEEYNFQSCAEVERKTLINAGRIQSAIHDYKLGKREIPLVEGFCWLYVADKDEWLVKVKAWINVHAEDNRKTNI